MTYSAYNGHLSRALRSAATSRPFRCGPDQSGREPFCGSLASGERKRGGGGEEKRGRERQEKQSGPRRRETAAETWKASLSKDICALHSPPLHSLPCHLCRSVPARLSISPFLIAPSGRGKKKPQRYPICAKVHRPAKDVSLTILDLSTKLKMSASNLVHISQDELI